jgi:mono/diheme cytochrome c family protein
LFKLPRPRRDGQTYSGPGLIDEEYLAENFSDTDILEIVLNGSDKMPSQKKNVTSEEITEIIKYLRYSQKAAGLEPEEDEEENGTKPSPKMN